MERERYRIAEVGREDRDHLLVKRLLAVWEASVRASHHFLTEEDILRLSPYAGQGLRHIRHLMVVEEEGVPVGFMGVQDRKIEMLFLHPDCFRKGLGKRLVRHAFSEWDVELVDVNEQNPDATAFYRRMGFEVFRRNGRDGEGNPFPILEMRRTGRG